MFHLYEKGESKEKWSLVEKVFGKEFRIPFWKKLCKCKKYFQINFIRFSIVNLILFIFLVSYVKENKHANLVRCAVHKLFKLSFVINNDNDNINIEL